MGVIRLSEYLNNRFNLNTTPRMLGICCSGFGGIWGGSQMVPFEYAPLETQGLEFVISFAIGALMITIMLWFIRYLTMLLGSKTPKLLTMNYQVFMLEPCLYLDLYQVYYGAW